MNCIVESIDYCGEMYCSYRDNTIGLRTVNGQSFSVPITSEQAHKLQLGDQIRVDLVKIKTIEEKI